MWQLFSFGAIITEVAERLIDKTAMISHRNRDAVLAAFQRVGLYCAFALISGLLGIFGPLHFIVTTPILILAALDVLDSVGYSIILSRIEITGYAALRHITPFLFLVVDIFFFKAPLSPQQIIGVVLLTLGGLLFILDVRKRKIRKMYTRFILLILGFGALLSGFDDYLFKHYHSARGVNEISFITSVWGLAFLG